MSDVLVSCVIAALVITTLDVLALSLMYAGYTREKAIPFLVLLAYQGSSALVRIWTSPPSAFSVGYVMWAVAFNTGVAYVIGVPLQYAALLAVAFEIGEFALGKTGVYQHMLARSRKAVAILANRSDVDMRWTYLAYRVLYGSAK